jgi:hypothetical protein
MKLRYKYDVECILFDGTNENEIKEFIKHNIESNNLGKIKKVTGKYNPHFSNTSFTVNSAFCIYITINHYLLFDYNIGISLTANTLYKYFTTITEETMNKRFNIIDNFIDQLNIAKQFI